MSNSLTRNAGLRLGPLVLETLVKHYFDRIKKENAQQSNFATQLHQDELLYHEAFNIVKSFLEASTYHTVEEVQAFSNNRTPSLPSSHVVRLLVPLSCCNEAASYIIQALGGEELAKRLVGGTKWWQVRGVKGIDAEWITARKDYQEAKKRSKAKHKESSNAEMLASESDTPTPSGLPASRSNESNTYKEEMDDMRCILYAHGGGYYFGSVDQERYSLQRHARKINGRVFAINYRLAPQYPFPCALQDLLAAYLYLIQPPSDASHQPVQPARIVIAGDSAGGGLTLALLQILRDTGLPLPAGGILISPWCDLTHSFPSIHTNTATDVIPAYGLSFQKPSPLWPPPSDEMTSTVHSGLRKRIRQMIRLESKQDKHDTEVSSNVSVHQVSRGVSLINLTGEDERSTCSEMPVNVGATAALPSVDKKEDQAIRLLTNSGELLVIEEQVHMYAQNSLLGHPLVSPALSYLGGLPPLLFIVSDKEVLRDEAIYSAHKAAYPSRYPLKKEVRSLYPPLKGIEDRFSPTAVHLQVYDDTAHVLPVLFSFTTPGKFCYRAIASFTKHVTGVNALSRSSSSPIVSPTTSTLPSRTVVRRFSLLSRALSTPEFLNRIQGKPDSLSSSNVPDSAGLSPRSSKFLLPPLIRPAVPKSASDNALFESTLRARSSDNVNVESKEIKGSASDSTDNVQRFAGESRVYCDDQGVLSWKEGMIRERVSTSGVLRPLEPEADLDVFHTPPEIIGELSELAVRRYIEGKGKFDKKFAKDRHAIQKQRHRNLELSRKDIMKNIAQLQDSHGSRTKNGKEKAHDTVNGIKEGLEAASASWSWAWALDVDERPPPSSIVSRRDTDEARRLARIADQAVLQEHSQMNANSLWAVIVNFLTITPERDHKHADSDVSDGGNKPAFPLQKRKSLFASLRPQTREVDQSKPRK
ncbi:alpha/beta-hydrolase [Suillus weaverae]|nr:alpha/beta-hydrolase [Suillus weaverae]